MKENMSQDELKKMRRMSYIKMVAMVGIVVAILAFSSIAWFTMNREVEGSGVQMAAQNAPFELEVRGEKYENSSTFSKSDSQYVLGAVQNNNASIRQTTASNSKIIWQKSTSADGSYPDGLVPNAHGSLSFWVVPQEDGTLSLDFTFHLRGYFATYNETVNSGDEPTVKDLYEITNTLTGTESNGLIDSDTHQPDSLKIQNKKDALEYLNGHILFFAKYDETTGYYSDFLGTGQNISFGDCYNASGEKYSSTGSVVSVTKGDKYPVTIYWKWANTFEQMVFDSNSPNKDEPLFAVTGTTDRNRMYEYLEDETHNKVFKGVNNLTTKLNTIKGGTNIDTTLKALSDAYNNADQLIGNEIDYILIEMTADSP